VHDLDTVVTLARQLAEGRHDAMPADGPDVLARFTEICSQPNRSLLVAAVAENVLGMADLVVVANLTHGGRPWAIVENVIVDENCRNGGIGRALMGEALARAERAGCYKVQLLSRKNRSGAHAFYARLGFEASAEGFRRYLGDGTDEKSRPNG
jgi:GNAT superfamily N-acetyltransferase